MNLPVIGALYEAYFRPDTYHRQNQRLIYGDLVATIVRAKVMEFCAAAGVKDPDFRTVSNPEQILSEKELARLTGREDRDEGKRGGSGRDGQAKAGRSG